MPAQTVIKIRRDTSTNWDAVNPTLAAGEIAFETDTNKIKVGDGSTVWASLDYASGAGTAAEIGYDNVDAELIATTVKGALDELSLTKADVSQLSTNLAVFATTAASDISGYNVLVSSVDNPDYNTTAVNVPTGAVNADGQLIASLASDAGLFEGQVDPITVTTLGNIRKTAGNANQSASFYFEVYVRNAAGTETLVGTSDDTGEVNPPNLNEYQEFSASSFVSFGTVGATDRIVLKFYGNVSDGAGAEYDFQFGGGNPVRTLIPVPATVAVAHIASSVEVDTTNFDGVLSGSDTTVQAALETLDDLDISAGVITSDSPPSSPSNGDLWWESDTGILYIYYDNFWVEAVAGIVGPQGESGAVVADTEPTDQSVLWVDTSTSATAESTLNNGTQGLTAVSNGTAGLSYQPVSHNYIINGAFDIWQRGESFTAETGYTADRWTVTNGRGDVTKSTDVPNDIFDYSLFFEAGVDNFSSISTRLESADTYSLLGKSPLRFSAYIKVNQAALDNNAEIFFQTPATKDDFNSALTIAQRVTLSSLGVVADTWQRIEYGLNFPLVTGNVQNGLQIRFDPTRASGAATGTIYITGVQLEAGSIATPFKRNANSIQGEKAACERYYQRYTSEDSAFTYFAVGQYLSTTTLYSVFPLRTKVRRIPDINFSPANTFRNSIGANEVTSITGDQPTKNSFGIKSSQSPTTTVGYAGVLFSDNTTTAFIEVDAEL